MKTSGISPKVVWPFIGWVLTVLAFGLITGDLNREELGIAVAGLIATVTGYRAPPGEVAVNVGESSDALLGRENMRTLEAIPPDEPTENS